MSILAVAQHAGVSSATVSRVLNDRQSVRPETAQQVRAAMQAIGYQPPRIKRGPKPGRRLRMHLRRVAVTTLGSFRQWLSMPVMAAVVSGITHAARELDMQIILDEVPDPASPSPIWRRCEVDGALVFIMAGIGADTIRRLRSQLPFVWVMGAESDALDVDHVTADNIGIGRLACENLVSAGCENPAFVTDAPSWPIMRMRGQSFADSAHDARRSATSFVVIDQPTDSASADAYGVNARTAPTLETLVEQLAAARPRPDGLFIPTDLLTTKIYPLLIRCGLRPDQDIRIISCDNERERLDLLTPRPASIDIRGEAIGRMAVQRLVQRRLRPDDCAIHTQIAPHLVRPAPAGRMPAATADAKRAAAKASKAPGVAALAAPAVWAQPKMEQSCP